MKALLEQVSPPQESSFVAFTFKNKCIQSHYHYHPEIELTLIVEGRGQCLVGDHLGPFEPGDLYLLGSNLPHSYFHVQKPEGENNKDTGMVLQFSPEIGGGLLHKTPEWFAYRSLLKKAGRGLSFDSGTRQKISPLFKRMINSTGPRRLSHLLEILDVLSHDEEAQPLASLGFNPEFNQDQTQRIERVCAWISTHFRESLTLEEAARQAHMTPGAFSSFFHRTTKCSFVHYVNEMRIGYACCLLLETDKTVVQIAFESGFENLSNFNRRFREIKKITPSGYRASVLNGDEK